MYESDSPDGGSVLRHAAVGYAVIAGLLLFLEGILEVPLPLDNVLVDAVFFVPLWVLPAMIVTRSGRRERIMPDLSAGDDLMAPFRQQDARARRSGRPVLSRLQARLLARAPRSSQKQRL